MFYCYCFEIQANPGQHWNSNSSYYVNLLHCWKNVICTPRLPNKKRRNNQKMKYFWQMCFSFIRINTFSNSANVQTSMFVPS